MEHTMMMHIKPLWPIFTAAAGFLIALFVAMRYKLPDLTRRMKVVEDTRANSSDVDRAIDGFRVVCKFNQVSCQKEMAHSWASIVKENDRKLSDLYEKLNSQMIEMGKLVAKVDFLIQDRENGNGNSH